MTPTAKGDVTHVPVDPDVDVGPLEGSAQRSRGGSRKRSWTVLSALACGGAAGAVTRYAVSLAVPAAAGQFPWDTFAVNVSGSLALGVLLILLLEQFPQGRLARPVVGSGFIGAYTTFSTFMVDAVKLAHDGKPELAAAYVVASLLCGLIAVWAGMLAARALIRTERWLQDGER